MKKKQELSVVSRDRTTIIPNVQELLYAEKKPNKKTGAVVETIKAQNGDTGQLKKTKTGGQIVIAIKEPQYSDKSERNNSIRDHAKNGINQNLNALAHNVSQSTVSKVVNEKKK